MTMVSETSRNKSQLSYRERDVDDTLDDHENRLNRLEKVMLVAFGYGIASGAETVTQIGQFL